VRGAISSNRAPDRASNSQLIGGGKEDLCALGWGTGKDLGVLDVGHAGGRQRTSTYFMIVPERRAGVVVLINLDGGNASDLATELMKIVLASAQPTAK
jgi:CubicO group peptidase (beta-lactamase class C family)